METGKVIKFVGFLATTVTLLLLGEASLRNKREKEKRMEQARKLRRKTNAERRDQDLHRQIKEAEEALGHGK